MTNKERSEKLISEGTGHDAVHDCLRSNCSEHDTYEDCENALREKIELALDEAEERGRNAYYSELMKEKAVIDRRQVIEGQKEMRERAKNKIIELGFPVLAHAIRDLPIEGENHPCPDYESEKL